MKRPRTLFLTPVLTLALLAGIRFHASAEQSYLTRGEDRLSIGTVPAPSTIRYEGRQTLAESGSGASRRFVATVRYARIVPGARTAETARFVATIGPGGAQRDEVDEDPNYLTVLDQPFALVLDAATLHDLAHLAGAVPFDFPSPIVGQSLHGTLRRLPAGDVGPRPSVGVGFSATGPIAGPIPGRPELRLSGTITMVGEAYYDARKALLTALDSTLTITGRIGDAGSGGPVTIVYKRTIRTDAP